MYPNNIGAAKIKTLLNSVPIIIYFFGIIVSLLLNIITNPIMKTKSLHKLSDFIDSIYDEL